MIQGLSYDDSLNTYTKNAKNLKTHSANDQSIYKKSRRVCTHFFKMKKRATTNSKNSVNEPFIL